MEQIWLGGLSNEQSMSDTFGSACLHLPVQTASKHRLPSNSNSNCFLWKTSVEVEERSDKATIDQAEIGKRK
jgi:hypothetical protein